MDREGSRVRRFAARLRTASRRAAPAWPAALALLLAPAAGGADDRVDLLDVPVVEAMAIPAARLPGDVRPPAHVPGLLTQPPGWSAGDAAVVLLAGAEDRRDHRSLAGRVAAALLAQGAAVLEPDGDAARGPSPDGAAAAPDPSSARELLPDLFGALQALRGASGAGLVLAIGTGAAHGAAALLAVDAGEAAARLRPGEPGFAAAAALGDGLAAFAAGDPPPPAERWERRVPPLCALLAELAWTAGERAGLPGAAPHPRLLAAECLDRLLPGQGTPSARIEGGGGAGEIAALARR